jgi:REP element-mobilizing transposase RayT
LSHGCWSRAATGHDSPAWSLRWNRSMGRPLRRHEPGQYYLVTTRCHQSRFFLRPDRELNDAVLEWLARAQRHFPRLRILAICVMSNHLHLVVRDEQGDLASWASYFLGHLARAVNRIRERSGACFARRYSAEPILDDEALLECLVYVATNPVKAGLCKRVREWPGVVLFAEEERTQEIPVAFVDREACRLARGRAGSRGEASGKDAEFHVRCRLTIGPFARPGTRRDGEGLRTAIEARERDLAEKRRRARRKTMTRKQVLAQRWHAAPRRPKRSPRPLCHASDSNLRKKFRRGFDEFVSLFREASELLRSGKENASFPDWCYPPGCPLFRPTPLGEANASPG